MNLKKLLLLILLLPLAGCWEKEIDEPLIRDIWQEVVRVHRLDPKTPMPEIAFLEEDIYRKLVRKDCSGYKGSRKEDCLEDRKELEEKAEEMLGRDYDEIYKEYVEAEWRFLREDCSQYQDKKKIKQCKKDKKRIENDDGKVFGRAFFGHYRAEIYPLEIYEWLASYERYYRRNFISFSYLEQEAYFYGVIAHEDEHLALNKLGVPASDQHKQMLESGSFVKILDFISKRLDIREGGIHRELSIKSLKHGIEGDEVQKRIQNRESGSEAAKDKQAKMVESLIVNCPLNY